jgi:hydrogenase nickel incorporation protein HypB
MPLIEGTEGEDKPLKYSTIFNSADEAAITKMELANAMGVLTNPPPAPTYSTVQSGMQLFTVSSKVSPEKERSRDGRVLQLSAWPVGAPAYGGSGMIEGRRKKRG